jgi:chromosomal replication initiator protein
MWEKIVNNLSKQLTQPQYEGWVKPIQYLGADDQNIFVAVPNEYYKNWINKNLFAQIQQAIHEETGKDLHLNISVDASISLENKEQNVKEGKETSLIPIKSLATPEGRPRLCPTLNMKYTFDSFVVGPNNKFAYAVAKAAGEKPGRAHNPFFIYGGVGLGKTHLMQAIGHSIYQRRPESKIKYSSVENFTNDLIDSIRRNRTDRFRSLYRDIDVLLLDDVQFLQGKEITQEELFNTFNTLYEAGKQIVFSSDRAPKQIPGLEERLVSRFEWGITVDIQAPGLETRIAILQNKAQVDNMNVPYDVLELIATAYQNNIRELEGALNKVITYVALTACPMNVESVRDLVDSTSKVRKLTPDKIIEVVADYFKVSVPEIKGASRMKEVSQARQISIYIIREVTRQSFPSIAEVFSKKHSSIMYAYEKVKTEKEKDRMLAASIADLMSQVT